MATSVSPNSPLSPHPQGKLLPSLVPLPRPQARRHLPEESNRPLCSFSRRSRLYGPRPPAFHAFLPSVPVAGDGSIDLLLFALDWREQIFICVLTLESVNPAQPFAQDVASHR